MLLTIIVSYSLPCLEFHLPLFNHRNPSQSHVYFAFPPLEVWCRVPQIRTAASSRFRLTQTEKGAGSLTPQRLLLLSSLQ